MGEIGLVDGDGKLIGLGGHLDGSIDDAAVVLAAILGGEDEEAVGKLVHGQIVHKMYLLLHVASGSLPRLRRFKYITDEKDCKQEAVKYAVFLPEICSD